MEKVEIPEMKITKQEEKVKELEMTEEQKKEAHIMFHELLKKEEAERKQKDEEKDEAIALLTRRVLHMSKHPIYSMEPDQYKSAK